MSPLQAPNKGLTPSFIPWMVWGYIALLFIGAIALRWPGVTVAGNELSPLEAFFESANTLTLTNLATSRSITTYTVLGRGILVSLTAVGLLLGMLISSIAVVRITAMRYTDKQVVLAALWISLALILIGTIMLWGQSRTPLQAMLLSLSAYAHGGLSFGPLPGVMDWQMHAIILPVAFLGGMGLPVLMELADKLCGHPAPLSSYSKIVITLSAGVYVIGTALVAGVWHLSDPSQSWRVLFAHASVGTVNATGVGLPVEKLYRLPSAVLWLFAAIMLIGTAPGGAASGLRITTLAVLYRPIRWLRKIAHQERQSKQIYDIAVAMALLWCAILLSLTGILFITLLLAMPSAPADHTLFNALSATMHTGPGLELGTLHPPAALALTIAMLLARLIPWLLLWALATKVCARCTEAQSHL